MVVDPVVTAVRLATLFLVHLPDAASRHVCGLEGFAICFSAVSDHSACIAAEETAAHCCPAEVADTDLFHRANERIERELDDNEQAQRRSQRDQDGSEIRSVELEPRA